MVYRGRGEGCQGFIQDFEFWGEQDGNKMIVSCESIFTRA